MKSGPSEELQGKNQNGFRQNGSTLVKFSSSLSPLCRLFFEKDSHSL